MFCYAIINSTIVLKESCSIYQVFVCRVIITGLRVYMVIPGTWWFTRGSYSISRLLTSIKTPERKDI